MLGSFDPHFFLFSVSGFKNASASCALPFSSLRRHILLAEVSPGRFKGSARMFWLGWCLIWCFWNCSGLSTCLSSGIPEGVECAEDVLTSQFIVTLAKGLSCSCHCSKSWWVERAHEMEWAASIWPGSVCGGACGAGQRNSIFPLGLSEVEPLRRCKGAANETGLGLGSCECTWGARGIVTCMHRPVTSRGSKIQCFPQVAQLLKRENYYCCFSCLWDYLYISNEL